MNRSFNFGTLAAAASVALVGACSGNGRITSQLLPAGSQPATAHAAGTFPGTLRSGISAHYVVFAASNPGQRSTIDVVFEQSVPSYVKAFPAAKPLSGATITYPDGTTQTTAADGRFDAGASSYAKHHAEGPLGPDTAVTVNGPTSGALKAATILIFTPSETEERRIQSAVIPPNAVPSASPSPGLERHPMAYVWSCDPADYEYGTFQKTQPNSNRNLWFIGGNVRWWAQHFYTCGTDQPSKAVAWSSINYERWDPDRGPLWHVEFKLSDGFANQKTAVWASPDKYTPGSPGNRHIALVGY